MAYLRLYTQGSSVLASIAAAAGSEAMEGLVEEDLGEKDRSTGKQGRPR